MTLQYNRFPGFILASSKWAHERVKWSKMFAIYRADIIKHLIAQICTSKIAESDAHTLRLSCLSRTLTLEIAKFRANFANIKFCIRNNTLTSDPWIEVQQSLLNYG